VEQNLAPIQAGYIDEQALEIVDLIHQFSASADFANWITDGRFTHFIAHEHVEFRKYMRTYLYKSETRPFFHGRIEVDTDKMNKEVVQILTQNQSPVYSMDSHFNEMKKANISRVIVEPYYTLISHVVYKNNNIGMCWEIYNLSDLAKIYNKKNDPLRYWRTSRRQ
jgi:hypothetical protein